MKKLFQSTHPLRGATVRFVNDYWRVLISIHAPLAGCDKSSLTIHTSPKNFNPRTPCGVRQKGKLQKTVSSNFNPRTHCGVRLGRTYPDSQAFDFNPRTPCGVRHEPIGIIISARLFQSTHPLRGATTMYRSRAACMEISIHAPLAGCDPTILSCTRREQNFNPRTPCGVRQQNCRNIPGKFAQKLQNFCKAEQRAALPRVGQRESGRYFRPCAVRTSRGKPERFRFASDNERALRSVARLCAEVLDAGFILVSKVIKA